MRAKAARAAELGLRHEVERVLLRAFGAKDDPHQAPGSERRVVLGLSGGEDSAVLFHVLCSLRERLRLDIVACHVDHALRDESASDAAFVAKLAEAGGARFFLSRPEPREPRENMEAWGRRVRYAFFEETRKKTGARFILTAHHRNDQAETVLFRLLTGRVLTSAKAIAASEESAAMLRPLLRISKAQIREYALLHALPFVEDASNQDPFRTRNRIRHELLPMLEDRYNPNLAEDLSLLAARLEADDELLSAEARRIARALPSRIPLERILELHAALRWRVLAEKAGESFGRDAGKIGYHAILSLLAVIEGGRLNGPKTVELGFGFSAEVHPGKGVGFLNSAEEIDGRSASIIDTRRSGFYSEKE